MDMRMIFLVCLCVATKIHAAPTTPGTTPTTRVPPSTPNPSSVYVRLAGGSNAYEGRVEVYAFGKWGTICDDSWNNTDANVICNMLGYSNTGAIAKTSAFYGQGEGNILLDNVQCRGTEASITSCASNGWGINNCGHSEDAGVSCATKSYPDNFLLFTDTTQRAIFRMDLTTQSYVRIPTSSNDNPIAIDYDPIGGRIYWTDVGLKQIRSATIDGNSEQVVRILGQGSVADGIAVDSISRLLFYTDTGNDIIAVMALDGSEHHAIINSGLDEPRAIVVDPIRGIMYWSDWGNKSKIETANYDGTQRRAIIDSGIVWPNAITVDTAGSKIYWADGHSNTIESANLDGSQRHIIHQDVRAHYFGLVFFQGNLYYTDWLQSTVMKTSASGGSSQKIGPPAFGRLNDIHIYKSGFNPSVIGSACTADTDCSGVTDAECPMGDTRTCTCKAGYMGTAGETACTKRTIGDTCAVDGDCSGAVTNSNCHEDSGTKTCMCSNGYTGANGAAACTLVYDTVCANTSDCAPSLAHSTCKDDAETMKCKCVDGYTVDGADPKICISIIDSTCTANADCSGVADAECPTGDTRTCTCKAGYMGTAGDTACTKRKIGDSCAVDSDCSSSVTISYCHDNSGTKTCMCSNGYNGAAAAETCTQIYDTTCQNDTGCVGLKYGTCSASLKCACNTASVVEIDICKIAIGGSCDTEAEDICPSNAACTGSKCICNSNYETKYDKCTVKKLSTGAIIISTELSTGAIIGIVLGCVAFVAIVVIALWRNKVYCFKQNNHSRFEETREMPWKTSAV